eukprot:gene13460-9268_t
MQLHHRQPPQKDGSESTDNTIDVKNKQTNKQKKPQSKRIRKDIGTGHSRPPTNRLMVEARKQVHPPCVSLGPGAEPHTLPLGEPTSKPTAIYRVHPPSTVFLSSDRVQQVNVKEKMPKASGDHLTRRQHVHPPPDTSKVVDELPNSPLRRRPWIARKIIALGADSGYELCERKELVVVSVGLAVITAYVGFRVFQRYQTSA